MRIDSIQLVEIKCESVLKFEGNYTQTEISDNITGFFIIYCY